MRSEIRNPKFAIALLGAVVVLLSASLLPLPRLILSEEEEAAGRMPQTQAAVKSAQVEFGLAETDYKGYVATHDVGMVLDELAEVAVGEQDATTRLGAAQPVIVYLESLRDYARAGETYFSQLKHYDDELMAWTRSLGAESEVLRADTWPIVEYLKLYPPPVGLDTSYSSIGAANVQELIDTLKSPSNPDSITQVIADVRAAGRSIEYVESLHPAYETFLQNYHTRLEAVASDAGTGSVSGGRAVLAFGANALVAVLLVAGLAALFISRTPVGHESAP